MPLDPRELEELLRNGESDRVERKESLSGQAADRLREAICAFANDLPDHRAPGVAFVGVRDDGTASGLPITDELLRALGALREDGLVVPPPSMTVRKVRLFDGEIAVVEVRPSDAPPVRCRGNIWVRVGPRRSIASAQDERVLNERRRATDRPFDARPLRDARLSDLDRGRFEGEYLPNAISREALEANERSYEQRLAAAKMIASADDPTPTVLGCLVLAPRCRDFLPGAYIQFLRVGGRTLSDEIADERDIDGLLTDAVRGIDEKLSVHLATAVDFHSRNVERRRSVYPRVALQQLTRNAIMHRSYEATNAPIRVTWYDDRIEIVSPGGPYGIVHRGNFGNPGITDYRNPSLAEAMKVLGFVQRFGVGIATARRALDENGNPPLEFDVSDGAIAAIVRRAP